MDLKNFFNFNKPDLSEENVLDFVLKEYELSGITRDSKVSLIQDKQPDAKPICSKVFVIGNEGKAHVIKENIFEILEHDSINKKIIPVLLDYLYERGIKVLPLYRTKTGNSQAYTKSGHWVEIIDFIPNSRPANVLEKREQDIKVAAKELARFHKVVQGFDKELTQKFKQKSDSYENGRIDKDTGKTFLEELKIYQETYKHLTSFRDKEILKVIPILIEDYERIESKPFDKYKEGINHRDTHTANLIIHKQTGEFKAFLDWDIAKYSPFVHDLAYAVDSFSSDRSNPFAEPNLKQAGLFLKTYLDEHTLPSKDIKYLFDPLREDMVDRTAIFFRANYNNDEELRSGVVASHAALQWRIRQLEKILK